ncbi:hypothetical protein CPB97_008633 [Podila verticillata]|nr:hypothetical protein CPB97_008633 [Podila verticillata]
MVTEDLPHLEFLDINMPFTPTKLKYILENLPESIKEVCLVVYGRLLKVSSGFTPLTSARPKSHRALTSLRISGLDGLEEFVLLPFLETCNKLRHFDMGEFDCFKSKKIADALLKLGMEAKNDRPREWSPRNSGIANAFAFSSRCEP